MYLLRLCFAFLQEKASKELDMYLLVIGCWASQQSCIACSCEIRVTLIILKQGSFKTVNMGCLSGKKKKKIHQQQVHHLIKLP